MSGNIVCHETDAHVKILPCSSISTRSRTARGQRSARGLWAASRWFPGTQPSAPSRAPVTPWQVRPRSHCQATLLSAKKEQPSRPSLSHRTAVVVPRQHLPRMASLLRAVRIRQCRGSAPMRATATIPRRSSRPSATVRSCIMFAVYRHLVTAFLLSGLAASSCVFWLLNHETCSSSSLHESSLPEAGCRPAHLCLTGAPEAAEQAFNAGGAEEAGPFAQGGANAGAGGAVTVADGSALTERQSGNADAWGQQYQQWDEQQTDGAGNAIYAGAGYWDGEQYRQPDVPAADSQWQQGSSQDSQHVWAQSQVDTGAAASQEQQWQHTLDNPTFVETALGTAAAPPTGAFEADLGVDNAVAVPGKQPVANAGMEAPRPAEEEAGGYDFSDWQQQQQEQPEQPTDSSDPTAWQQQPNGWHTKGAWPGETGPQGEVEQGQTDQTGAQAFEGQGDFDSYGGAPPLQWDRAKPLGDLAQQDNYGDQQQEQQLYAGYEAQAAEGEPGPWDASQQQQQQYGEGLPNGDGQQYEHDWGADVAASQRGQGFGGDEAQVCKLLVGYCSSRLLWQLENFAADWLVLIGLETFALFCWHMIWWQSFDMGWKPAHLAGTMLAR